MTIVAAMIESVAEILRTLAGLELIVQAVDDLAVETGRGRIKGCRNQSVGDLRPLYAVEQRRLMVEIGEGDRYQIDTRRAQGEVVVELDIEEGLLDFDRAME